MKVSLFYPPTNAITVSPPLGIGYLAGTLLKEGVDVQVEDLEKKRVGFSKTIQRLKEFRPDVVGVTVTTPNYLQARAFIELVRREYPEGEMVIGGPHVAALPEISIRELQCNYAIVGEAEIPLAQLVKALAAGGKREDLEKIDALAWRQPNGEIRINTRSGFVENLDDLPFPAWDLIEPHRYPHNPHQLFYKKFPIAPIITSRGCPYDCKFCASPFINGKKMRFRSAANVVDEMLYLRDKFGVKEIHIEDDNFTLITRHAVRVCEEMIRRKTDMTWKTPNGVRIDRLNTGLLALMKRAGCYQISLGVEAANQDVIDAMDKGFDLRESEEMIREAKRVGIEVLGLFILGFPGETRETALQTIQYSIDMPFDLAHFSVFSLLPGAEAADMYLSEQGALNVYDSNGKRPIDISRIKTSNGDRFITVSDDKGGDKREAAEGGVALKVRRQTTVNGRPLAPDELIKSSSNYFIPIDTEHLTSRETKQIQRLALLRFYLRPKIVWYMLRNLRFKQIASVVITLTKYLT